MCNLGHFLETYFMVQNMVFVSVPRALEKSVLFGLAGALSWLTAHLHPR